GRAVATRPIAVKLSPVLPDIAGMARVAEQEAADAVTLVNTIPGMLDRRLGNGAGGVSGPALLAIGVLATRKVRTAVAIPVIGVGGIRTAHDAREYLTAGASLVAIGTAALADPRVPERVARELGRGCAHRRVRPPGRACGARARGPASRPARGRSRRHDACAGR